jgi:hypothetical protein
MATPVSWLVTDNAGAAVDDAFPLPTVTAYASVAGARAAPAVVRRQPGANAGLFGINPTDADAQAGTAYVFDNGAGNPGRSSGAVYVPGFPIIAVLLEDNAGALWGGAGPTFGAYVLANGGTPTPPTWVAVAGSYLWIAVPSAADVAGFVSYTILPPAGASQTILGGSPFQSTSNPAPVAGTLRNPALDLVNYLSGKAAGAITLATGSNLFAGQMRSTDTTASPGVWCLNTGGPAPIPYLGGHRSSWFRPTVQLMVRGPMGDQLAGEAIARDVLSWVHQATVAGYAAVFARDSAPAYLGEDQGPHGLWSINVELQYATALGA